MLFKLSLKNIKKSIKDYSIYFFTLVFAVAIFYIFNSIDAQSSMLVLNSSKNDYILILIDLINYVSVFVSIILGFLIVYSNNFLIKRRKKEIGLYEILGMSKRKISLILFLETVFVGIISLLVGLLVGVFLSQFLSIFVSKLFEVNMSAFKFVFSSSSFNKTILYFGIIFLFVIVFNVITLNRYKIIDLIYADRKNEQVKIRNKYVTIITFILSIICLGYAYYMLIEQNVLVKMDYSIAVMLVLGSLGTFLLFFSLSGFLLKIFEHIKRVYYKDLNLFTLKQVNSRINTNVISTTVICLMLLLTIGMLSGSMSLAKVFNGDFKDNNPTDYTVKAASSVSYVNDELIIEVKETEFIEKLEKAFESKKIEKYSKEFAYIHKYYDKNLEVSSLMNQEEIEKLTKEYGASISLNGAVTIISESEYKKLMELVDKEYIDIKEDEYLLLSNIDLCFDSYKSHYEDKKAIKINGHSLTPGSDAIIKQGFENGTTASNEGIIVVSDELIDGLDLLNFSVVGNFVKNDDPEKFEQKLFNYLMDEEISFEYLTRVSMEASSIGLKVMVIFMGFYLGITFAISSATVLAIGQLSESSDNKKRYKILTQIGADNKMINKALFTQIAIAFIFPLIVALIHAFFGLKEVNSLLVSIGSVDLTSNILLTTLFMIVVYGGYFLLTYICSKNIIKQDN